MPPPEPAKTNPDGYVHARDAREYQRLRNQGRMWQAATEGVLDAAGLGPGMSCLDVGCGPGAVMRLMAKRVGPKGKVTGLDIDGKIGAFALAELRAEGGAEFAFVAGDVLKLDTLPGAAFDLSFCRFVLMHLADPTAALEKMLGWTKRGGVVVAQEFDFGAIAIEPVCPPMAEFNRLFEGVFRAYGRNMRAGRQLPAQFEAAGLGAPDQTAAAAHFVPLKDMADMLIDVYDGLFTAGAELGIANQEEATRFRREMQEAAGDGRYYCLPPILISAWKRVR
jgi:ubiquinone/menaquinone biosynthesis C-methylase UbiE